MLNKALHKTIATACTNASIWRHEFATIDHLLLALMENHDVSAALSALGINIESMRHDLADYVNKITPIIPETTERQTQLTVGFKRTIKRAKLLVETESSLEIDGVNVIASLFNEKDSFGVYLIKRAGISQEDVENYIDQRSHNDMVA